MLKRKMTVEAEDQKQGMTVNELLEFAGELGGNMTNAISRGARLSAQVTFKGRIKSITVDE